MGRPCPRQQAVDPLEDGHTIASRDHGPRVSGSQQPPGTRQEMLFGWNQTELHQSKKHHRDKKIIIANHQHVFSRFTVARLVSLANAVELDCVTLNFCLISCYFIYLIRYTLTL